MPGTDQVRWANLRYNSEQGVPATQAPPVLGCGPALREQTPPSPPWNSRGAVSPGQSLARAGVSRTPSISTRPPSASGSGGGGDCRGALAAAPSSGSAATAPFPQAPRPPARAGVPDPGPSLLLSLSPPSRCCHSGGSEDLGQSARSGLQPLLPPNKHPSPSLRSPDRPLPPSARRVARASVKE